MPHVKVWAFNDQQQFVEVGRILYRDGKVIGEPADVAAVDIVLRQYVRVDRPDGEMVDLYPKSQPEQFMAWLSMQYSGSYLRCGDVEPDAGEDGVDPKFLPVTPALVSPAQTRVQKIRRAIRP